MCVYRAYLDLNEHPLAEKLRLGHCSSDSTLFASSAELLLHLSSLFIFFLHHGKASYLSQRFRLHLAQLHAVTNLKQSTSVSSRDQVGIQLREW